LMATAGHRRQTGADDGPVEVGDRDSGGYAGRCGDTDLVSRALQCPGIGHERQKMRRRREDGEHDSHGRSLTAALRRPPDFAAEMATTGGIQPVPRLYRAHLPACDAVGTTTKQ